MDFNSIEITSTERKTAQATLFKNVYSWMALALIVTGLTSFFVANSETLLNVVYGNKILFYIILFAPIGLVWYLSARINTLSLSSATLLFIVYSVLNGLTFSFIFLIYTMSSISSTFFITAGTFAAMALIGTFTKRDLSKLGGILIMALIGLIIASVVNIFWNNGMMAMIISYVGVLLFVGLTAYDAQKIKRLINEHGDEVNESTQKIALLGALTLYLDFINLFLFLLRILGSRK